MAPEPIDPQRLKLQTLLTELLAGDGKAYFQPPETVRMTYPAITYVRDSSYTEFADNGPYRRVKRWTVTHISRDPDDRTPDKIEALPLCEHNRFFVAENLNHNVFTLYF